jgi:hypothetical protein
MIRKRRWLETAHRITCIQHAHTLLLPVPFPLGLKCYKSKAERMSGDSDPETILSMIPRTSAKSTVKTSERRSGKKTRPFS